MMPGYLRARAEHKHPLSLPVATDAERLCCKCPHPTTAECQRTPSAPTQPRRIPAARKAIRVASHCPWAFPDADLCAAETAGPIRPVQRHPATAGREAQVRRETTQVQTRLSLSHCNAATSTHRRFTTMDLLHGLARFDGNLDCHPNERALRSRANGRSPPIRLHPPKVAC